MIGILLVTHGNFSKELIKSMELIVEYQEKLKALTLTHGDDIWELAAEVEEEVRNLNDGDGVLVMVDLLGGSPSNITASLLKNPSIECITGLNLPMLIEAITLREEDSLEELKTACWQSAIAGIIDLRSLILA